MSYVDAYYDKIKDIVFVSERVDGNRVLVEHRPDYTFFVEDPRGNMKSIYGHNVSEVRSRTMKDFRKNLTIHNNVKTFESDIKPLTKTIAKHYIGAEAPNLHIAFFDIEVDFSPERGYANPDDPFMPITAIGVYLQWCDEMLCFAVPPKTLTWDQAQAVASTVPGTILFEREQDMIEAFLGVIEDADILSGWNSEGYDIPYMVNRITKIMGKTETRRLSLWDQMPRMRTYEAFGSERITYDLTGRVHLDLMQLYRKYNYEERHSYSLDAIAELEVGERKTQYEGSLDRLYNHDFKRFLEYNVQDVMLLHKIDSKLQFIDLANTIAHANAVLLPTTMGAVATTEQAIINEAHRRGMVVPDRKRDPSANTQAAGAYVANPKKGYHEWVGSMDINSLYPSVFRALNMGNETIVGQVRQNYTDEEIHSKMTLQKMGFADAWADKFGSNEFEMVVSKDTSVPLHLDLENGTSIDCTGLDIYNLVFNSDMPWNITANGTIFTTDVQGVVPGLLERWYSERKEQQAKKKSATTKEEIAYWDKRQLVTKISLNSLYGAILNPGCRFFDKRIGQSTTLTGRRITRHMAAHTNELLTGEYNHLGKCIIYGDTDSVYFTAKPMMEADRELTLDEAISLYDEISDTVSDGFPKFLKEDFNVPLEAGAVLKAGREVVGRSALFITKKRYAINCWDIEGKRIEGGKLKVMGMEIKRSDTPEFIQNFLEKILWEALNGVKEDAVVEEIRQFKRDFQSFDPWQKGMPKRVNNLTSYTEKLERLESGVKSKSLNKLAEIRGEVENKTIPGHVRASINWNRLKKAHSDNYSSTIIDGSKVIVCRLKDNPMGYTSIAYPVDQAHLPDWFKDMPFDEKDMETAVLDKKIVNVIGQMGWDLSRIHDSPAMTEFFDFG